MSNAPFIPIINVAGETSQSFPALFPVTSRTTATQFVDTKLAYNPAAGVLSVNNIQYANTRSTNSYVPRSAQTYLDTPRIQAFTAQRRENITDFLATITPSTTSSKIFISVRWMGEFSNDNYVYNSMWGLTRNGDIIGPAANPGVRVWGMQTATQSYVTADNNSTPETVNFTYLDSPNTTQPCTYQVTFLSYVNITLYTGRTIGDLAQATDYERGTASISLIEVA